MHAGFRAQRSEENILRINFCLCLGLYNVNRFQNGFDAGNVQLQNSWTSQISIDC